MIFALNKIREKTDCVMSCSDSLNKHLHECDVCWSEVVQTVEPHGADWCSSCCSGCSAGRGQPVVKTGTKGADITYNNTGPF
jgi:hypothetical protein